MEISVKLLFAPLELCATEPVWRRREEEEGSWERERERERKKERGNTKRLVCGGFIGISSLLPNGWLDPPGRTMGRDGIEPSLVIRINAWLHLLWPWLNGNCSQWRSIATANFLLCVCVYGTSLTRIVWVRMFETVKKLANKRWWLMLSGSGTTPFIHTYIHLSIWLSTCTDNDTNRVHLSVCLYYR